MSVLDKVRKLKATRPKGGGGGRLRGIFHQWKDGDNPIRLVGEFVEVRTHFVAPAPKRGERGLCIPTAFQGDNKLPQVVNCLNWDVATEEEKAEHTCPICKLHAIAVAALKENPDEDEKKFFDKLRQETNPRPSLKWNILDRDDPHVVSTEGDTETKVMGLKIATVGMEAWNDIEGIFEQCGFDITDPVEGVDVKVNKGHNGTRVCYSAQAVIEGTSLKVTPLTDEEKALRPNDLKVVCGKMVDSQRIVDALHDDLRQIYDFNVDEDEAAPAADAKEDAKEEAPAKKEEAPKGAASKKAEAAPAKDEAAAIDEAIEEDGGDDDGLVPDDSQKKS
jgi:hypothetical protein